jgi:hypothetical protein
MFEPLDELTRPIRVVVDRTEFTIGAGQNPQDFMVLFNGYPVEYEYSIAFEPKSAPKLARFQFLNAKWTIKETRYYVVKLLLRLSPFGRDANLDALTLGVQPVDDLYFHNYLTRARLPQQPRCKEYPQYVTIETQKGRLRPK